MSQSPPVDLYFYVKCAKPLIFALSSLSDRSLACAWLKRLVEDSSLSELQKNNYVKLLIYFLQKRKLGPPFNNHPSKVKDLAEMPQSDESPRARSYNYDFSGDLLSYVAYQDIEDFGVHCYYAMSKQPITVWDRFDKSLFPSGVERRPQGPDLADEDGQAKAAVPDKELEEKKNEFAAKLEKKVRGENKKVMFLVSPLGTEAEPDDRIPPSWGSNLLLDNVDK
ncbi:uncharacterized protein LOC103313935 isoform X2 [Tribolium castaneum]|uniref:uncharacterized protein LOC103313935 isoform X2 n=1 Tax=Tribolium castaneum TaxID=7070 RepID=UPI00046C2AEC|nr:PREDICTED: uncharacterized protein LOC103313935 isoform X2 [Tribolium castaneum]|eukprot:XP_008196704.1 PREDICTED: uncharacterized protein LOC103313935 isoform X2 [Tribolium castaneum]